MTDIFAVDPGPEESGWVLYQNGRVFASGVSDNDTLMKVLHQYRNDSRLLAVEMIASYGMPVGREVFETCVFIGRLIEAWADKFRKVYRQDVKLHLCKSNKAKDGNIRQALIDKLGPQGTKKYPGPTYGIKSHAWAALGVAVTAAEQGEKDGMATD